jgi:transcriptional regulator with XRE-family HTH domain
MDMNITLYIRENRLKTSLSQQELAKKVGVSQAYISKLENKTYKAFPSFETLDKIAKALDTCFYNLFEYDCKNNCKYYEGCIKYQILNN